MWERIGARDRTLDGWVIVGVRSTGIYCRPDCPARTPKRSNVDFFADSAAARAAGLRACKRCAPDDAADGWAVRHLEYRAPLAWDALLRFFGVRAVAGVEEVDGEVYRRSLVAGSAAGSAAGSREGSMAGVVEMRLLGDRVAVRAQPEGLLDTAVNAARAMLDLATDPAEIADGLSGEPVMAELVAARPGLRVPGAADPHELAIRAVLGQQISVARARTLAERLVAAYGEPLADPVGGVTQVFPTSPTLAEADADRWGMPGARKRALQGLAGLLASGELELDPAGDRERTVDSLLAQPGIGPWTASYIAMRALRDRDAFLPTDVGVRHALDRLGVDSRPRAAEALSQAWRPYRAYALQQLWTVAS